MDQRLHLSVNTFQKRASLGQVFCGVVSGIEMVVPKLNGELKGIGLDRGRSCTAIQDQQRLQPTLQNALKLRRAFKDVLMEARGPVLCAPTGSVIIQPLGSRRNLGQGNSRNCSLWLKAMPGDGFSCESSVTSTAAGALNALLLKKVSGLQEIWVEAPELPLSSYVTL